MRSRCKSTTVDGVVDVPLWTVDHGLPEDLSASVGELTASSSAILLGRRTLELFAPACSTRTVEDDPGAPSPTTRPQHVVSSTLTDAEAVWRRSTSLGGYDPDRLRTLKARSPSAPACGSSRTAHRGRPCDCCVRTR